MDGLCIRSVHARYLPKILVLSDPATADLRALTHNILGLGTGKTGYVVAGWHASRQPGL